MTKFSFGGGKRLREKKQVGRSAAPRSLRMENLEDRQMLTNNLVITEINYHPSVPYSGMFDKDEYEYIEFYNAGDSTLTLTGVQITATSNLNYTFPAGATLGSGQYGLIVHNTAAMQERYGANITSKIVGQWTAGQSLANSGSTVVLMAPPTVNMDTRIQFTYDDGGTGEVFPGRADGSGSSLQLIDPSPDVDQTYYADANNWENSREYLGSPGRAPIDEHTPRVVINEVLANSNNAAVPPEVDKIELVNVSNDPVNLSGWILTDNSDNNVGVPVREYLGGYQIPAGTVLQPGQYIVFSEPQFNPIAGNNAFALSSAGERLYLTSLESDGTRLFEDIIDYDATRQSESIGRAPDMTGRFLPLVTQTFGAANSSHRVSDVVISEIMYNRPDANDELTFVEIHNRSGSFINLAENGGWEIDGIGMVFASPALIAAGSTAVVVKFAPTDTVKAAAFRTAYGISSSVPLLGPFTTNLSKSGERLRLLQPYNDGGTFTKVLADSVDYDDSSPWPEGPDGGIAGTTYSLTRTSTTNVGDLPHSWRSAAPSPGTLTSPSTTSPLEGLVISEVMYNPRPDAFDGTGAPLSNNHLEYVEILNTTASAMDLSNAGLSEGVSYRFPASTTISSGERVVVVPFNPAFNTDERTRFLTRYGIQDGEVRLFGPWTGSLNNGGEGVSLVDGIGNTFFEFTYNDAGDWPLRAAGRGSSLELVDPTAVPAGVANAAAYVNDPTHWRASTELDGSPGAAGVGPLAPAVVINEVQSHTDPPFTDAIELVNVSGSPVNIGNWYLTDNMTKNPQSSWFTIPALSLNSGEYVTFDASPAGFNTLFNLNAAEGEQVYLIARDGSGAEYFADAIEFPATFSNVSLGRWPNGAGEMFPMTSLTLSQVDTFPEFPTPGTPYSNGANSGPKFDDVVISEVMYNPLGPNPNDFEYIELQNRRGISIPLGPIETGDGWVGNAPEGWRLRGSVDFDFTSDHSIPALGTLVLVSFDPVAFPAKASAFRSRYGIGAGVQLVGPFNEYRTIPDDGGVIRLEKPDAAPTTLPDDEKFTPNVLVDRVTYSDTAPWPTSPDGTGQSLTRLGSSEYGDMASSWSGANPTPGTVTQSATAPRVTNVVFSGTSWNAAFKTAVTAPGSPVQGYAVPKGAQQATAMPWSGVNQVSITFDRPVTISSSALAIHGVNTANYSVSPTATNPAGNTYTWTINTPITGDRLRLILDDQRVNSSGALLDGEWTDNVSTGNSGNGTAGGDFQFRVNVLPGDADGDGSVDNDDFVSVAPAMFTSPGVGPYDVRRDLNTSGKITVVDWIVARNRLGASLPAGTPNSPAAADAIVTQASRVERRVGTSPLRAVIRTAAVDRVLAAGFASDDDAVGSAEASAGGQSPLSAVRARRAGRAAPAVTQLDASP